jgi:AraC-like DNA-binding protein
MIFYPVSVILFLIGFQSLLFSLFLIFNPGEKKLGNRLLAAFLLTLSAQTAALLIEFSSEDPETIYSFMCIFGFTYGPLLFLYSLSLIGRDFKWKNSFSFHFLPPLLFLGTALADYPLCTRIGSLLYLSLVAYTTLAILEIRKYRKIVKLTQSTDRSIDLQWLQWTLVIFCVILFSDIVDRFVVDLDFIFGISLVHLGLLFMVNWIFYKGLKHPQIFQGLTFEERSIVRNMSTDPMLEEEATQLTRSLNEFMEREKPYLNPELTLNELASSLGISPRKLSRLINTHLKQNFSGFINGYRIDLARERLAHPKDPGETVLEVMYEVGFKSKSSFNTLFKEKSGLTPTDYKKSHSPR